VEATANAATDAAGRALAQAAPAASGLAFEVRRTGADVTALTTSPLNVQKPAPEPPVAAPPPAPAPAPVPPPAAALAPATTQGLVPTCIISFEARSPGATLAIDHSPRVPLPARFKIGNGRHTLFVQRGATKTEKRELLLCGHIDTFPVEGP
jgi:hypothetical protein